MTLMATNLEIAVSCIVRGKIEEAGEFTIPSKLISEYVALLPKERVDVAQEGTVMTLSCGQYKTKINGTPSSEYPLIPTIDVQQSFTLDAKTFKDAVSQVLFAVSLNESRPEITGILLKFSPGEQFTLTLAATDSYRLAERIISSAAAGQAPSEAVSVIVPARSVAEFVRSFGALKDSIEAPEKVNIGIGDNQVKFSFGPMILVSRTIEGKYPDYRQLIPEKYETVVTLTKSDLQRAVKTASLFSKTGLNDVQIELSPGRAVRLSSVNSQTGEHNVDLAGEVKGKGNKVTLNFRYLLDGVSSMEAESVQMHVVDGISPCLVTPQGEEGKHLYIVMPIRQ